MTARLTARNLLQQRRVALAQIASPYDNWPRIEEWIARTRPLIVAQFAEHLEAFDKLTKPVWCSLPIAVYRDGRSTNASTSAREKAANTNIAQAAQNRLLAFIDGLLEILPEAEINSDDTDELASYLGLIENLLTRFHTVARQLRNRHQNRDTLKIEDEYDVQDLLHALLRIHFDDVREEEYAPSYAGGASRIDFLLKPQKIVIEVKKTRNGLEAKQVGEQLIVDVARYKGHPDCRVLVCFIYDPEGRIGNCAGLISDLERLFTESMTVRVFVNPL